MKEFEARDHVGGFQMSASSTASSDTADKGGQQCHCFTLQDKISVLAPQIGGIRYGKVNGQSVLPHRDTTVFYHDLANRMRILRLQQPLNDLFSFSKARTFIRSMASKYHFN